MGENFVWGKSVGLFPIKILDIIKLAGSSLGFLWLPPWPEMAVAELSRAGQAVWPTCQPAPGFSGLLHRRPRKLVPAWGGGRGRLTARAGTPQGQSSKSVVSERRMVEEPDRLV